MADYAVQAIICMVLNDLIAEQDCYIVGEEDATELRTDKQASIRKAVVEAVRAWRPQATEDDVLNAIDMCNHDGMSNGFWALDPIDGTKGFLRGKHYAIALGRIEGGTVVAGVMGCPNLSASQSYPLDQNDPDGVVYAASKNAGAWEFPKCDPRLTPMKILASHFLADKPLRFCESAEKKHSNQSDSSRIINAIGNEGEPARLDSQCKYALVARGQADGYLRLPTNKAYVEKIWDHAAGMCIAQEAGALVTDINGKSLDFSHGARLEKNRGVICAIDGLQQKILNTINTLEIGKEEA